MKYTISLTKTENSKLGGVDFNNIPFGRHFSDHIFIADFDGVVKEIKVKSGQTVDAHSLLMVIGD